MELVGLYVYSEAKEGRDAGELCGVGPTGVRATRQVDDIVALRPDCVLYMGDRTDVDLLCRLLESGANVVATRSDLHHPASMDPEVRERLEAACRAGGSSLHSTGSSPGFITEALPLVLTSLERRLDRLTIEEYADMSSRNSPEMLFDLMGFGAPRDAFDPGPAGPVRRRIVRRLAQRAGRRDRAAARRRGGDSRGRARPPPHGDRGRCRRGGHGGGPAHERPGRRDGSPLLEFRATWYVTADLDPAWDLRDTGWRVRVAGDLPLDVEIHFPVPGRGVGRHLAERDRPPSRQRGAPRLRGGTGDPHHHRSAHRRGEAGVTSVGIVVGNPKPGSRTLRVAEAVADAAAVAAGLDGADRVVVDLATLGPELFDWSSARVRSVVDAVAGCALAVVASPTYKATYTGLLKAFLDWYPTTGLSGVAVVPVMVGAGPQHALAVEVHLRPVLVEIGATLPTRGLYVTEGQLDELDAIVGAWVDAEGPRLRSVIGVGRTGGGT